MFNKYLSMSSIISRFFILLIALSSSLISNAQGNLLVSPKRLVFDGGKKTQELNIANTGKDTATYIISTKEIRMTENGAFEEILQPDSGQYFASKNLRFYPRTVVLAPNEAQTIKVQLTKVSDLQPGEYRSHIYFRAVPKVTALGESTNETKDSGISVNLTPVFGITIPAIIRIGDYDAKVNISDASISMVNDTLPRLSLALNRTGNMSVYGDIHVEHISPSGKKKEIGSAVGVSVYTPNSKRRFQFDLTEAKGIDMHKGKLLISYRLQANDKAIKAGDEKSQIIAETELQLN